MNFSPLTLWETFSGSCLGALLSFILCTYILETDSWLLITLSALVLVFFCNLLLSWAKAHNKEMK